MQNNYVFLNNSLISFNSLIDQSIFLTAYPDYITITHVNISYQTSVYLM